MKVSKFSNEGLVFRCTRIKEGREITFVIANDLVSWLIMLILSYRAVIVVTQVTRPDINISVRMLLFKPHLLRLALLYMLVKFCI